MGCFSYICKVCNRPIRADDGYGEGVKLFLLQDGEVLEEQEGDYGSYGNVEDQDWTNDWNRIVDLMFNDNESDGIAAIHTDCWNEEIPTTQSKSDPHQGWGKVIKDSAKNNYHKFYKLITNE